ncbi:hypothetical protein [Bacillus phage BUCT082]|nr:hypothetical protein [Bacillus phage BUCT082]
MTMLLVAKYGDSVIMTADKRVTEIDGSGEVVKVKSDEYEKIKVIDDRYVISFAGVTIVAERAFEWINQNLDVLTLNDIDPLYFFKKAFNYGKEYFEAVHPGHDPITVFYLGYITQQHEPILIGFSSDDNYNGMEIQELSIKMVSKRNEEAETYRFVISEVLKRKHYYQTPRNFARLNFKAIKRIDDEMIGKTAYSIILSPERIKEYHHK